MTFPLRDHYENPLEDRMATAAFLVHTDPDSYYESDGEALFALLVRGLGVYVQAWVDSGDGESLAAMIVQGEDLDDPTRADDPDAALKTMLDLTLEAMRDNIMCELDPDYGRVMPDE